MNNLVALTTNIRKWNKMGFSLLPQLQLVIIQENGYEHIVSRIITDCNAMKIQLQSQVEICSDAYSLYLMKESVNGRLHIIRSVGDKQIEDHEFRRRTRFIQKFKRTKDAIFILFSTEQQNNLTKKQEFLSEFGLINNINRFIKYQLGIPLMQIYREVCTKYEEMFKFELVSNYKIMKNNHKIISRELVRYLQWKQVLDSKIDMTTFALKTYKMYTDAMQSSFSGTFNSMDNFEYLGLTKSMHWKVMEILDTFWETESDKLLKAVDGMTLAYIEQHSNSDSIGGFIPETCFKFIFSPPLHRFRDTLLAMLENINLQLIGHLQLALSYFYKHTSIQNEIIHHQVQKVQQICNNFIIQFTAAFQAQIQFIHANAEDYWNFRYLQSNLYSPEQQTYIEIKSIGRTYVRRIYENVRQNVPRTIGYNLMKKIVKYLSGDSFYTFLSILNEKEFMLAIDEEQIQRFQRKVSNRVQIEQLQRFFSLKVSSVFLIKDFHAKIKKDWERMFGVEVETNNDTNLHNNQIQEQKGGFGGWIRKIFGRNTQKNKAKEKRAKSTQKNDRNILDKQELKPLKQQIISDKQWLLIINTNKSVPQHKLIQSSLQGFSPRFRSAIWAHIIHQSPIMKSHIKLSKLLESNKVQPSVQKQIEIDVWRTPPVSMFRYSLKQSLTNVLFAYSLFDSELQYTQGMNFIVADALLVLTNYQQEKFHYGETVINFGDVQEKAFCILKYLMNKTGIRKLMLIDQQLIADMSLRLDQQIEQLSPQMSSIIHESQFNCSTLFLGTIISALSSVPMQFGLKKRFMDIFMTHDMHVISRIIARFVAASQFQAPKLNQETIHHYFSTKMYDEVYCNIGDKGITRLFNNPPL